MCLSNIFSGFFQSLHVLVHVSAEVGGFQENVLKIKMDEMRSIWRARIWRAKGRDAETV